MTAGFSRVDGTSSGDDDINAFAASGDGSFDTIKRKKNKGRKSSTEDRRSDTERDVRSSVQTAIPAVIEEENKAGEVTGLQTEEKGKEGKEGKVKEEVEGKGGRSSNKNSPSTSPPPVSGAVSPALSEAISSMKMIQWGIWENMLSSAFNVRFKNFYAIHR